MTTDVRHYIVCIRDITSGYRMFLVQVIGGAGKVVQWCFCPVCFCFVFGAPGWVTVLDHPWLANKKCHHLICNFNTVSRERSRFGKNLLASLEEYLSCYKWVVKFPERPWRFVQSDRFLSHHGTRNRTTMWCYKDFNNFADIIRRFPIFHEEDRKWGR